MQLVVTPRYIGYPSGTAVVAAALRHAGVEVELRDHLLCRGDLLAPASLAALLADSGDLAWICCGPEALPLLVLALPEARRRSPGSRFVVAERVPLLPKSAGPTAVAEELLRLCPELDGVALGESDVTASELGAALPEWRPVAGMVWREDGGIRTGPPRPRADPIPEWPGWRLSATDLHPYREMYTAGDELYYPIAASRGCAYCCAFCSASPILDHHQVRRTVANVVDEIERLRRDTCQARFSFVDETFVLDRRWVLAFCAELGRRRLEIAWRAAGRVNLVDRELLDSMAAAGCESLELGVESGSDAVLARIDKRIDSTATLTVARQAGAAIGHVECNFIWGFPFETTPDLAQSLLVMEALDAMPGVYVKLTFLQPHRPSRLYDEYRDALRFDPFWHRLAPDHPTMRRVLDLAANHLHTFSGFGYLDHPDLEEKLRFMQRTGLHDEVMANGFTASLYR